jgi:hypothetical protein
MHAVLLTVWLDQRALLPDLAVTGQARMFLHPFLALDVDCFLGV